ncbi:hypothetical protein CYY_002772 [Polysphondylium violaceum]|uniref:Uncharacterized protein n=1 Tax=Polysphondylium violaceum TaxID=133409 RepID=A0A8J4Q149_9MYCE|nr:hypothetical protein CYY_002772 [Polysphondylium violaceum]
MSASQNTLVGLFVATSFFFGASYGTQKFNSLRDQARDTLKKDIKKITREEKAKSYEEGYKAAVAAAQPKTQSTQAYENEFEELMGNILGDEFVAEARLASQ